MMITVNLLIVMSYHKLQKIRMSFQPEKKDLFSSDRIQNSDKFNPSTSSASGSSSFKHLYRKQDPNLRKEMISRERKRRCAQLVESQVQICYISKSKQKQIQRKNTSSRVCEVLVSPRNIDNKKNVEPQSIKQQKQMASKRQGIVSGKRIKSKSKTDKFHQALQVEQLRLLKISLNRQIRTLKNELQAKDKKIFLLQKQIKKFQQKMNQQCKECVCKDLTITELGKIIQQQRATFDLQQNIMQSKNSTATALDAQQDIEKLLSDVQKTFEQMSLSQSKIQQESVITNQQRLQRLVINLQQKIKYQQIQIAMMKKYRFDQHRIEQQCERYRAQNKYLFTKIRTLHEQKQKKNYCDYSISFDLSREEEGSII